MIGSKYSLPRTNGSNFDIIGQRLNLLLSKYRCNICFECFYEENIIISNNSHYDGEKRFFALLYSKNLGQHVKKPIIKNLNAPLLKRHSKKPSHVFLREVISLAKKRKTGRYFDTDVVSLALYCYKCSNELKIEINTRNINNLCSK